MQQDERINGICAAVVERIRPTAEERRRVKAVIERLSAQLAEKAHELGIESAAISVGSTARDTWVHGEADIDIFLMFPVERTEEELKEQGLALAKSIADRYEERYAAHPYIHAIVRDAETETEYGADLVPCFSVADPAALKSAVDRTPFHNRYIQGRIAGREDDVLLLKQFLKVLGFYGSELRRRGFAGYLCELLVLHYSSFLELLKNAAQWQFGERIDLEGRGTYRGDGTEPLIVIDPVDPKRNVAAAVSVTALSRFIDAAREFLASPSADFFQLRRAEPMSTGEFAETVRNRGTEFVLVSFAAPDVVEDILFPQLRKAETSVRTMIARHGFQVYRSEVFADGDNAYLLFELLVWALPRLKRHIGPPVTAKAHAERFKQKYQGRKQIFIEDGRYVVEVARPYTDVVSLLKNELLTCSLGKQVAESIAKGYEVLRNEEIEFTPGIGAFFSEYFRGI